MGLDANIILQGYGPDIVGSIQRGNQAGQEAYNFNRQKQVNALYQAQGPQILAGEQNAMNSLAQFSPQEAQGIQANGLGMDAQRLGMDQTRQNMAFSAEEMQMKREEGRRLAQERLANVSKEEAAAKAAEMANELKGAASFYARGDRAGYDAFIKSHGLDPAEYSFDQFPAHASMVEGVLDVLKSNQDMLPKPVEWRAATPEEAAANGAAAGQVNNVTGKFDAQNPPSGMRVTTNADGTTTFEQGPGVGGKPLTEAATKDIGYAARVLPAADNLDKYGDALTGNAGRVGAMADSVPLGLAKGAQSDDYQKARQAAGELATTMLRKDSGAAISAGEYDAFDRNYIPQPGDGAEVLAQKKNARRRMVDGLAAGLSPEAAMRAAGAINGAGANPAAGSGSQTPPAVLELSPENQAIYDKYN